MSAPVQDLSALPWRTAFPDAPGYWWVRLPDGETWAQRVLAADLVAQDIQLEQLREQWEPDPLSVTPDEWVSRGLRCCPVVVIEPPDAILAAKVCDDAADRCGVQQPTGARGWLRRIADLLWAMSGETR